MKAVIVEQQHYRASHSDAGREANWLYEVFSGFRFLLGLMLIESVSEPVENLAKPPAVMQSGGCSTSRTMGILNMLRTDRSSAALWQELWQTQEHLEDKLRKTNIAAYGFETAGSFFRQLYFETNVDAQNDKSLTFQLYELQKMYLCLTLTLNWMSQQMHAHQWYSYFSLDHGNRPSNVLMLWQNVWNH